MVGELAFRQITFGFNRRQKSKVIDCPGGRVTLERRRFGVVEVTFPCGCESRRTPGGVLVVTIPHEPADHDVELLMEES